jgi:hypothetical protein
MASGMSDSVRDRLLNRTRTTGENHQVVLTLFALERFLYRLTQRSGDPEFVLKGAFAFLVWEGELGRTTRDLDLLGRGEPEPRRIASIFRDALTTDVPEDGVTFDLESLHVEPIREDAPYDGLRATLTAYIGSARLPLQVDVGFGDIAYPPPERKEFPGLLDFPVPQVKTYPPESVVAEKLHAMVRLGRANSRMKDFYDVWHIQNTRRIESADLIRALRATFERRETPLPDIGRPEENVSKAKRLEGMPVALTETFSTDPSKQRQWAAFGEKLGGAISAQKPPSLKVVVRELQAFLVPPLRAARYGETLAAVWPPGGPWTKPDPGD